MARSPTCNLNKYLYGGKELQDGMNLGLYDFHARFYNPLYARWFNIDPALQTTNPYLYCGNSPMMYVDKDGEFFHLIIGAAIGGIANWIANGAEFSWEGLGYFGIGAFSGALSAGVGAGVSASYAGAASFGSGFLGTAAGAGSTGAFARMAAGAATGATNGFVTGFGNGLMQGRGFWNSLSSGFTQAGVQGIGGGLTGGVIGGIDAWSKGINFFTGVGKFNLSDGLAASVRGFDPLELPEETISGTYVGKYENVKIYETKAFGGGITIPERGIIVGKGTYAAKQSWGEALIQHEFGHILQYRMIGPAA